METVLKLFQKNKNKIIYHRWHSTKLMFQGLDNVSSATLRPFNSDINTPRIDSYRFSMANLEGKLAHWQQPLARNRRLSSCLQFPSSSCILHEKTRFYGAKNIERPALFVQVHPRM